MAGRELCNFNTNTCQASAGSFKYSNTGKLQKLKFHVEGDNFVIILMKNNIIVQSWAKQCPILQQKKSFVLFYLTKKIVFITLCNLFIENLIEVET